MSSLVKALFLGIIEGATEFLPVSSTGHLILFDAILKWNDNFSRTFNVVIQSGAILAVIIRFFPFLFPWQRNISPERRASIFMLWGKIIAGVIPALIAGSLLGGIIEEKLFTSSVVAGALLTGGIILLILEKRPWVPRIESISEISFSTAIKIGIFQCTAMVPGVSRSAATIIGGMLLGASRSVSTEFSFFLAIPTIIAASSYSILKHGFSLSAVQWELLAVGFVSSFITAFLVISAFVKYIKHHNLCPFAYYRIVLALAVFLIYLTRR